MRRQPAELPAWVQPLREVPSFWRRVVGPQPHCGRGHPQPRVPQARLRQHCRQGHSQPQDQQEPHSLELQRPNWGSRMRRPPEAGAGLPRPPRPGRRRSAAELDGRWSGAALLELLDPAGVGRAAYEASAAGRWDRRTYTHRTPRCAEDGRDPSPPCSRGSAGGPAPRVGGGT